MKTVFLKACPAVMLVLGLQGCAVVAVVDTAASITVSAVGLAADAAVGTVRVAGKVVGAAVNAVTPASAP